MYRRTFAKVANAWSTIRNKRAPTWRRALLRLSAGLWLTTLLACNTPVSTTSSTATPKRNAVALTAGGGQGATARYQVRLMVGAALPVGHSEDGQLNLGPNAPQHGQIGGAQ
jgi:hypothetical protein